MCGLELVFYWGVLLRLQGGCFSDSASPAGRLHCPARTVGGSFLIVSPHLRRENQNPHLGFLGWPVYVLRGIGGFLGASGVVCGRSIHCFHTAAGLPPAGWGSL